MALISRIGAAQDALEAILLARNIVNSRGEKVALVVGWPGGGPEVEQIWIDGGVTDWDEEQEVTGDMETADREETFVLRVRVLVVNKDSYKDARDRVLSIVGELEQALRGHFDLDGVVWEAEKIGGQLGEQVDKDGRKVAAVIRVKVIAYLGG